MEGLEGFKVLSHETIFELSNHGALMACLVAFITIMAGVTFIISIKCLNPEINAKKRIKLKIISIICISFAIIIYISIPQDEIEIYKITPNAKLYSIDFDMYNLIGFDNEILTIERK